MGRKRKVPKADASKGARRLRTMTDVGALLLAERQRRSLSQTDMAAMLSLTRQKVALLESGQPGVAAETVLRVLMDLGILLVGVPSTDREARQFADRIVALSEHS